MKRKTEREAGQAQRPKLSTLDSLLLLHGQSPSQPSYRQTVSSKYAGLRRPRVPRDPGPGASPTGGLDHSLPRRLSPHPSPARLTAPPGATPTWSPQLRRPGSGSAGPARLPESSRDVRFPGSRFLGGCGFLRAHPLSTPIPGCRDLRGSFGARSVPSLATQRKTFWGEILKLR